MYLHFLTIVVKQMLWMNIRNIGCVEKPHQAMKTNFNVYFQDELMFRIGATRCRNCRNCVIFRLGCHQPMETSLRYFRFYFQVLSLRCEAARWPLTGKQPSTITTGIYFILFYFRVLSLRCEAARWPLTGKHPPTIATGFY
uniref:Uncharacterized protein n=1 Tax=Strigamia maritima TaxID=126957 RepID=T1JAH5_STRMM